MLMDLAARLSSGGEWPDGVAVGEPQSVLYLSAEDAPDDTIRPRVELAGGNLEKVSWTTQLYFEETGTTQFFNVENHLQHLEATIASSSPGVVMIDPLTAYLGSSKDTYRDSAVRAVLGPLAVLAATYSISVIALMHLNKSEQQKALHRVGGSIAFTAAARAVFAVVETGGGLYFGALKMNIAPRPKTRRYLIVPVGEDGARVQWDPDPVDVDLRAVIEAQGTDRAIDSSLNKAIVWLRELLEQNGPMAVFEIQKLAKSEGMPWRTLERAKKDIGIQSVKVGIGQSSYWVWQLSGD
jgi:putative DNA primase/helicase